MKQFPLKPVDQRFPFVFDVNGIKTTLRNIHTIVLHHTGASVERVGAQTAERIHQWHLDRDPPFKQIGYHYVVLRNGLIQLGRDINIVPASVKGHNEETIAVVMTGNFLIEEEPQMLDPQARATGLLLTFLQQYYEALPGNKYTPPVKFHRELANTDCPGHLHKGRVLTYLDFVAMRQGAWRKWYVEHVREFATYHPGFKYVGDGPK